MTALAKPDLYRAADDGTVTLNGMRCGRCGRVAFPYQPFGCERCGSDTATDRADLAASGEVVAAVMVHLQPGNVPEPPFSIGAVRLDAGPMLRAYIAPDLMPGERVTGALFPLAADAPLELHFVAAEGAAHD